MVKQNSIINNCRKLLENPLYRNTNLRMQAIVSYWEKFDKVKIYKTKDGTKYLKVADIYHLTPPWHIGRAIRKVIHNKEVEIDLVEQRKRKEKELFYKKEYNK